MSKLETKENKNDSNQSNTNALPVVKFTYANPHVNLTELKSRDFYFGNKLLTIKQSGNNDSIPGRVWDACIIMTNYLDKNRNIINGKIVLELGAGLGLTSIMCSNVNAKHVYCTDIDKQALKLCRDNVKFNCKQLNNISVHEYWWYLFNNVYTCFFAEKDVCLDSFLMIL